MEFIDKNEIKLTDIYFNLGYVLHLESIEPELKKIADTFDLVVTSYRFDTSRYAYPSPSFLVDFKGTLENCHRLIDYYNLDRNHDSFRHDEPTQTLAIPPAYV